MKTHSFFKLTFMLTFHAFIALAVVSCTFKKDKVSNNSKTDIQVRSNSINSDTLEKLFQEKDETSIIEKLTADYSAYEQVAASANKSLLDYSISYKKKLVSQFLLINKQVDPFFISEEAYRVLAYNSSLSDIVYSSQNLIFMDILRNPKALSEQIKSKSFGVVGCQRFASTILEFKYHNVHKIKKDSPFFKFLDDLNFDELFQKLLVETTCANYVDKFTTQDVANWLSKEFLYQYHKDFKSIQFFKFLWFLGSKDSQTNARSFNVEVPILDRDNFNQLEVNYVKISPHTALMIKEPCYRQPGEEELPSGHIIGEWFQLVEENSECDFCDPHSEMEGVEDTSTWMKIIFPNSDISGDVAFSVIYNGPNGEERLASYKEKVCTFENGGKR